MVVALPTDTSNMYELRLGAKLWNHALGGQVMRADGAAAAVGVQLWGEARLLDLVQHRREQTPCRLHSVSNFVVSANALKRLA